MQYRKQIEIDTQQFTQSFFTATYAENSDITITKWFNRQASLILQTGHYENISLIDQNGQSLSQIGLPHLALEEPQWRPNETSNIVDHGSHTHAATRLMDSNGKQYWIIATSNNDWHTILFLKTLLLSLLGLILAASFIYRFAKSTQKAFVSPLTNLNRDIKKIIKNDFTGTINLPKNPHHRALTQSVLQLIEINRSLKSGMQASVENATQEIRETLESVEIQNIELDIARKKALQSSLDKSELLATTSHEIRTPLNGILGFSHLLLKTELSDQQKDYLATIEQSAQSLLTVINDIIDYSRLETGRMSFEYKPVSIRDTLGELLQVHAPSANENHLKLIQWTDPQLPDTLLGDPLRLKQVINNLIHSLTTVTIRGDIIIETRIIERNDSRILLGFTITNPSVPVSIQQKTDLESALSPQNTLPINNSAGIGLMIARTLAERMRGKIELHCQQDYLAFALTIELGVAEQELSSPPIFTTKDIQVVVCDNNPNSQKELKLELLRWNLPAIIENDIEKIALRLTPNIFHLVLIDCASHGQYFNRQLFLLEIEKLQQIAHTHIAIVATSNVRRQIEKDISGAHIYFLQRPLTPSSMDQLLQISAGVLPNIEEKPPTKPLHILVADDNPSNSKLVRAFLQQQSHIVVTVENGKEAVAVFLEQRPDIIFMDVQMPVMDGLEATIAIRSRESLGQRVPIIALTANTQSEQRARILSAGMDDYLTKPVSDNDLKHTLKRWSEHFPKDESASDIVNREKSPISEFLANAITTQDLIKSSPNNTEEASHKDQDINIKAETVEQSSSVRIFSLHESLKITNNNADLAKSMLSDLLAELPTTLRNLNAPDAATEDIAEWVHKVSGGAAYSGFTTLKKVAKETDIIFHKNTSITEREEALTMLKQAIENAIAFGESTDIAALFE